MENYTVLFYPKAQTDLLEIKNYFEKAFSISAQGFINKVMNHIPLLEENPYIYALVKDPILKEKGYRFFQVDNYLAFFVIVDMTVQIRRVLYGRRQYSLIL